MSNTSANGTNCTHNAQLLRRVYEESAQGKHELFRELAAEDITWSTIGTTAWSRTYAGRRELSAMFARLYSLLEGPPLVSAQRFIAEGDLVVVEARGRARTKAGKPYDNSYCMVFRLSDGRIKEVVEYCDTALIDAVL